MRGVINGKRVFATRFGFFATLLCALMIVNLSGCASTDAVGEGESRYFTQVLSFTGDVTKKKSIFVFFDGTANDSSSGTNVWQLYQFVAQNNDPQTTALYAEGVGSANDTPLTGAALGHGMEDRILKGYQFVSKNFAAGDSVYIFGFSRGAHQARALAGLISYAGVPIEQDHINASIQMDYNQIIELVKKKSDDDYRERWISWIPGQAPPLEAEIQEKLSINVQPVVIDFLGVWDTVPGSSLKKYGHCKEKKGVIKRNASFLAIGIDKGERYKTDSYPPIRKIVHAVSLDEKRSKFAPLGICQAINQEYTLVVETWFPGAHADVGGGYEDSNGLAQISLGWMIQSLKEQYEFVQNPEANGNPTALAHWSMGDSPANKFSVCEDRPLPSNAKIHNSFYERKEASPVPVRWKGTPKMLDYPISCSQFEMVGFRD